MKIGRDSGRYVPFFTVSGDGAIGPLPLVSSPSSIGDQLELVLVLFVVGVAEIAQRVLVAAHALDDHVVVLARGVVASAGFLFPDDRLGEVVERPGIDAGAEQVDLPVRPARRESDSSA